MLEGKNNDLSDPDSLSNYNEPKFKGDVIYATFMGQSKSKETFYIQNSKDQNSKDSRLKLVKESKSNENSQSPRISTDQTPKFNKEIEKVDRVLQQPDNRKTLMSKLTHGSTNAVTEKIDLLNTQ